MATVSYHKDVKSAKDQNSVRIDGETNVEHLEKTAAKENRKVNALKACDNAVSLSDGELDNDGLDYVDFCDNDHVWLATCGILAISQQKMILSLIHESKRAKDISHSKHPDSLLLRKKATMMRQAKSRSLDVEELKRANKGCDVLKLKCLNEDEVDRGEGVSKRHAFMLG